jgi:glycosyltransferase involved in cell wall biosynthesis
MLLSIIINTFERPESLSRCLEALERQKNAEPFEVVVVDDGGRLDLKAIRRVWETRVPLKMIRIEHAGRAEARNRGVEQAAGERILFLGDDIRVMPGCLERHRSHTETSIAVTGPYPLQDLRGSSAYRYWAESVHPERIEDPDNAGFLMFATGNLSMDRELFLQLGGFDDRFVKYGWEDIDLGLRFERAGGRLVFDEKAAARHFHPNVTLAQMWQREWEMGYTAWQFHDKWAHDAPEAAAAVNFWGDAAHLRIGPEWRRALGVRLTEWTERAIPESGLNRRLIERMVFAQRLRGVRQAFDELQQKDGAA